MFSFTSAFIDDWHAVSRSTGLGRNEPILSETADIDCDNKKIIAWLLLKIIAWKFDFARANQNNTTTESSNNGRTRWIQYGSNFSPHISMWSIVWHNNIVIYLERRKTVPEELLHLAYMYRHVTRFLIVRIYTTSHLGSKIAHWDGLGRPLLDPRSHNATKI